MARRARSGVFRVAPRMRARARGTVSRSGASRSACRTNPLRVHFARRAPRGARRGIIYFPGRDTVCSQRIRRAMVDAGVRAGGCVGKDPDRTSLSMLVNPYGPWAERLGRIGARTAVTPFDEALLADS